MHSWLIDGLLLAVSKHGGRGKRAEVCFLRAPILFMRVPPSWPTRLPKSPLSNTTTLRIQFSSVQSLICVWLFVTPWTAACHTSLSPTPGVHPNPCPLSRWCHPTISSSVVPFSSCPQSLPASGSFQMSQLFASGGQSIGVSASASVLPMNI